MSRVLLLTPSQPLAKPNPPRKVEAELPATSTAAVPGRERRSKSGRGDTARTQQTARSATVSYAPLALRPRRAVPRALGAIPSHGVPRGFRGNERRSRGGASWRRPRVPFDDRLPDFGFSRARRVQRSNLRTRMPGCGTRCVPSRRETSLHDGAARFAPRRRR